MFSNKFLKKKSVFKSQENIQKNLSEMRNDKIK